jgi:hypothetical protein
MIRKLVALGIKAEVLQLTFTAGALCGMAGMAAACGGIMLTLMGCTKLLMLATLRHH